MTVYINHLPVVVEKFPNNETHIKAVPSRFSMGNEVELHFDGDHDLFTLMFVRKQIRDASCSLTMRYVPYSRMDRQIGGEVFSLKHFCDFINWLDFSYVVIDEPHSDVAPALLNNVRATSSVREMLPLVEKRIGFDKDVDYLVFPDAGAQKRYADLKGYKTLVGHKHRDPKTGRIEKLEIVGDVPDENTNSRSLDERPIALILDDLCSYGGTFQVPGTAR